MSNYVQTTNFTALTTAQAVINGAAMDLEYGNVATAIASKFDNLAGGYTGPFKMNAASSNITLTVNGAASQYSQLIQANTGAGTSFGLQINGGTNNTDIGLLIQNAAASSIFLSVYGDGGVTVGSPTGASQGIGTINATGYYTNGVLVSNKGVQVVNASGLSNSRASTTSIINDTNLHIAIAAAGVYEFYISFSAAAGGASGLNFNVNYSGTIANAGAGSQYSAVSQTASNPTYVAYVLSATTSALQFSTTLAGPIIIIQGTLQATAAGTLALAWGPNSSSASASSVNNGLMVVTRYA